MAEALLRGPVVSHIGSAEYFNKGKFSKPTPPHQDNHYFCLDPPNVVTIWMALDTVDRCPAPPSSSEIIKRTKQNKTEDTRTHATLT